MFLWLWGSHRRGPPFSLLLTSTHSASLDKAQAGLGPDSECAKNPTVSLLTTSSWAPEASPDSQPLAWLCSCPRGGHWDPPVTGQTVDQALEQPRRPLGCQGRQALSQMKRGCGVPQPGLNLELWGSDLGEATLVSLPVSKTLLQRSTLPLSCPQHRAWPVPLSMEWMSPCNH